MLKYIIGLLAGIILGFILFGWLVAPTGVVRATWPVAMDDVTATVYLTERSVDAFRFPGVRRVEFSYRYRISSDRFILLPIMLWEDKVDECVKSCKVERSGDNIVIKFPFNKGTGASQYEFTPMKPPSHGTGDRTQQP
jgi:hypothetical protein